MLLATLLLLAPLQAPGGAVMVLPPDGPPEAAWLSELVAAELPRDLALLGVPVVEREDRLRALEVLEIPPVALTRATSIRMAEALGAGRLVVGTVAVEGETCSIALRLLDITRATLSAPLLASGPVASLGDLLASLAWDAALAGPQQPAVSRDQLGSATRAVSSPALRAYGQGLAAKGAVARIKLVKQAVQLSPGFDDARLTLARLFLEARELSAALEVLSRVPAASPVSREARFLSGVALLEIGRYPEAAALYAALAHDEPTGSVLNNHAVALLRAGTKGLPASAVLKKALDAEPASIDLAFNMGWALLREGQPEAAVFWLRGVVEKEPLNGTARAVLSWALRLAGRADAADAEWKGVMAMAPALGSLAKPDLARSFERVLPAERVLALDQQARSDSELAATLVARAERLGAAGDHAGALRELSRASYLDPYRPRVHLLMAREHRARGEADKAENELRMALWSSEDPAVRLELASLLQQLGRKDEARAEAARVLEKDPGNETARRLRDAP